MPHRPKLNPPKPQCPAGPPPISERGRDLGRAGGSSPARRSPSRNDMARFLGRRHAMRLPTAVRQDSAKGWWGGEAV